MKTRPNKQFIEVFEHLNKLFKEPMLERDSWLIGLREKFIDWLTDSRESRARIAKLNAAIDLIESHGLEVIYYRPEMGCQNAPLAQAFNTISQSNFVVMDKDGLLFGNRASIKQMSNEEMAREKRKRFFVVYKK